MLINERPTMGPIIYPIIRLSSESPFTELTCKYANLRTIREICSPMIRAIIDTCRLSNNYRYQVIDIKPLEYRANRSTTIIQGWHLDGDRYPRDTDEDSHHLIVFGAARTEFMIGPHEYRENFLDEIDSRKYMVWTIPEGIWIHYGNRNYHRGPVPDHDGNRLLIRITESNRIRPTGLIKGKNYV